MIEAVMAHFMKTISITGASLAIVRDEKLVYAKGFGKMNNGECEFVKKTTMQKSNKSIKKQFFFRSKMETRWQYDAKK